MVYDNHYPHNYSRSYGGNYDMQEHMLTSYSGDYRNLTPTIEQIVKWYVPMSNNSAYEHHMTEFNFKSSGKQIKEILDYFISDLDFTAWDFSDDADLNKELTNKFWTTWLKKHWQDAINYATYDMFLNELSSQIEQKMAVYGRSIKASATDLMWDSVSEGLSYNQGRHEDISNGSTKGNSSNTSTNSSESHDNSTSSSTSEDTHNNAFSDTPQDYLNLNPTNPDYASTVTADKNNGKTNTDVSSNAVNTGNSEGKSDTQSESNSNTSGKNASDTQTFNHSRNRPVTDIARDIIELGFFNGMMDAIDKDGQLFTSVWTSDIQTNHWAQNHSGDGWGNVYPGGRDPYIDNGGY